MGVSRYLFPLLPVGLHVVTRVKVLPAALGGGGEGHSALQQRGTQQWASLEAHHGKLFLSKSWRLLSHANAILALRFSLCLSLSLHRE